MAKEENGKEMRIRKNERKRGGEEKRRAGGEKKTEREREKEKEVKLLSKIYGDCAVGCLRDKKRSSSTRQELRIIPKLLKFHQTSRGRKFSYLDYF